MPDISIIIPAYNASKYIDKCIMHLCSQSFTGELELVFIDDCSLDDTVTEIELSLKRNAYKGGYRLVRHSKNLGVAAARVSGIQNATGDYILFCDSDDWMDPRMCEILYLEAQQYKSDLVVCDYINVYSNISTVSSNNYTEDYLQGLLLCKCTGSLWNKLIKRDLLIRGDFVYPSASFCEDYVYSIQLSIFSKKIRYVPEPLYYYYHREDSIVNSTNKEAINKRIQDNLANHTLVESILKKHKLYEKYYSESLALKLIVKNSIRAYFNRPGYYCVWLNTYPEMSVEIFKSRHIGFRSKVAYFATLFGLYPIFKKYI